MQRYRDDWIPQAIGFVAVVLIVGVILWWFITHKCVEEQSYACSHTYCVSEDEHGNCYGWRTDEDTCTRCLRWEKR